MSQNCITKNMDIKTSTLCYMYIIYRYYVKIWKPIVRSHITMVVYGTLVPSKI